MLRLQRRRCRRFSPEAPDARTRFLVVAVGASNGRGPSETDEPARRSAGGNAQPSPVHHRRLSFAAAQRLALTRRRMLRAGPEPERSLIFHRKRAGCRRPGRGGVVIGVLVRGGAAGCGDATENGRVRLFMTQPMGRASGWRKRPGLAQEPVRTVAEKAGDPVEGASRATPRSLARLAVRVMSQEGGLPSSSALADGDAIWWSFVDWATIGSNRSARTGQIVS